MDTYEFMQRYAVGLEQIAWDQEDHALEFRKEFKDAEYGLRAVSIFFAHVTFYHVCIQYD